MSVLYIIAGPNGIGKTTSTYNLFPRSIPIINSDEIAKEVGSTHPSLVNMQEFSNREAIRMVEYQRKNNHSFVVETNLSDQDTWKFFLEIQKSGYELHLLYISTGNLTLLNNRIRQRTKLGGHFIRPDIVKERYLNGISLLKHYINYPDKLQLFDNSENLMLIAEFNRGKLLYKVDSLPEWATAIFDSKDSLPSTGKRFVRDLSIEEVRNLYEGIKSEKTSKDKNKDK